MKCLQHLACQRWMLTCMLLMVWFTRTDGAIITALTDNFDDGNRDGFFLLDTDIASLAVSSVTPVPGTGNYLRHTSAATALSAFTTYFNPITLSSTGDFVRLEFDIYNVNGGFIDAGVGFGFFNSNGTRVTSDGDLDLSAVSTDDDGVHALVDIGGSTTNASALIRANSNNTNARLFGGTTIATADNDDQADPLMLTQNTRIRYTFELTRMGDGSLNVLLFNNESGATPGATGALLGNLSNPVTYTFDTLYFGGNTDGDSPALDSRLDNILVTASVPEPTFSSFCGLFILALAVMRSRQTSRSPLQVS